MTKEEVVACWQGCPDYCDWRDTEVEIAETTNVVTVRVSQMYEYVPLTLGVLLKLAKVFGTDKFEQSQYSSGGCETCDYIMGRLTKSHFHLTKRTWGHSRFHKR